MVTLLDVNDNVPEFLLFPKSTEIREDTRTGTSVLVVAALDADEGSNGDVMYDIIEGNFDGMYEIS